MKDFTPGPWKVEADEYGCKTIKGNKSGKHRQAQYTRIATTEGLYPEELDAANARLIATAPDLYDALFRLLELQDYCDYAEELPDVCPGMESVGYPCHWCQGRAALAKARGET